MLGDAFGPQPKRPQSPLKPARVEQGLNRQRPARHRDRCSKPHRIEGKRGKRCRFAPERRAKALAEGGFSGGIRCREATAAQSRIAQNCGIVGPKTGAEEPGARRIEVEEGEQGRHLPQAQPAIGDQDRIEIRGLAAHPTAIAFKKAAHRRGRIAARRIDPDR